MKDFVTNKRLIFSFLVALAVANVSGPQYVFPTYGTSLKNRFHWNGIENSMVSTAAFVGVSFSGPLCAWLIENYGFKRTLLLSSLTAFAGLFLLAETYAGYLSSSPILCSLYLICIGFAGAASYLCALDSQAHNFKSHRGMSMGFTSASLGLSGLVFSQINDRFFQSQAERNEEDNSTFHFLIFVGTCALFITLIGAFVLGPVAHQQPHPAPIQDIIEPTRACIQSQPPPSTQPDLAPPQHYPSAHYYTQSICSFSTSSTRYEDDPVMDGEGEDKPLLSNTIVKSADNICMIRNMTAPFPPPPLGAAAATTTTTNDATVTMEEAEEPAISGIAFFSNPIGLSLAVAMLVILGMGYVYLTNLGQLVLSLSSADLSLGQAQHLRNLHVSIFSLANCASRAIFGTLSDIFQRKAGIHRLWFFWVASVGLMISMVLLTTCVSTPNDLILPTISIAVMYGIAFGVAPATVSEFGTKTFARNWGWLLFAPSIGSQLYNVLSGVFYEYESERQNTPGVCYGIVCYEKLFWTGILSSVLCIVVVTLAIYKKRLFKSVFSSQ
ncbi:major facilitator superfamily domain-containing protein [Mycotypha africana]|uniref:major facilitator superfamily domain-containing protein n=1 Tax=Mycotypha africana TaxID=64632 RepID=UPI002301475A|nr:major facilitator superfamily domain-containing protein [Mycotypha africana]KAI8992048.1 major facilitator superfamily domain-containing protein [Mycotypha africana]